MIVVIGGWLRFAFIGRGYSHADEPIAAAVVAHLHESPGFDTNWAHSAVGDGYGRTQYNFSSYFITLAAWDRMLQALGAGSPGVRPTAGPATAAGAPAASGAAASAPFAGFRALSALLGTLALIVAMRLAWHLEGPWLALAIGAWLAVNPQLVQDSHYARPEAFLTLLALGVVWLSLPGRGWSWHRGLAAGALFGFLVACKVTMLLWGWVPFLACLDTGVPPLTGSATGRGRMAAVRISAVGTALAGGFAVGAPRVLADLRGYWAGLLFLREEYARGLGPFSHLHRGAVYDYLGRYLCDTTGWWVAALFGVGLVAVVLQRRWRLCAVVFAPVLTTAAFFGAQTVFYERNLSHVVPLYLLGAGLGVAALGAWSRGSLHRWRPAAAAALVVLAALLPAVLTVRLDYLGFSGWSEASSSATQRLILQPYAGTPVYTAEGSLRAGPRIFDRCWRENAGPFVMLWKLSDEAPVARDYQRLSEGFDVADLGRIPGLFDDLKTPSGLKVYFPCDTRVFLVRGVRPTTE